MLAERRKSEARGAGLTLRGLALTRSRISRRVDQPCERGEGRVARLVRAARLLETALPGVPGRVAEREPDEHLDVRVGAGHAQRLRQVRSLLRIRDAVRLLRLRLVA